jgi:DNA-binding transcriptional ArsR family regulator
MSDDPANDDRNPAHDRLTMSVEEARIEALQKLADVPISAREIAEAILEVDSLCSEEPAAVDFKDLVSRVFEEKRIPQVTRLAYLALDRWYNDTVEWAEEVTGKDASS